VLTFGLGALTHGRRAFINVPRRLLLDGLPESLPASQVVLELLEDIQGDEDVLDACRALRRAGYAIALDDFVLTPCTRPLVDVADYIKVDFLAAHGQEARREIVAACRGGRPQLLAEKVESADQFQAALDEGFSYFQGFFFGRPVTRTAREIPAQRLAHLRLLRALQDPALTIQKLDELIRQDVSLCFRVLRTVNSAACGQYRRIDSITQALVLMGVGVVRRWVSLWVLAGLSEGAHPELAVMSAVRARCCELLAARAHGAESGAEGFLIGMCSLLDVILGRSMAEVLSLLPLSDSAQAALLGGDSDSSRLLASVMAFERADWGRVGDLASQAGVTLSDLAGAYHDAMSWAADFQQQG
jgi:EAL and modified HD-GYP domain-containing signal transduction protein